MNNCKSVFSLSILRSYMPFVFGAGLAMAIFDAVVCIVLLSMHTPGVVIAVALLLMTPLMLYLPVTAYWETSSHIDKVFEGLKIPSLILNMLRLTFLIAALTIAFPLMFCMYFLVHCMNGKQSRPRYVKNEFDQFMGQPLRNFAH